MKKKTNENTDDKPKRKWTIGRILVTLFVIFLVGSGFLSWLAITFYSEDVEPEEAYDKMAAAKQLVIVGSMEKIDSKSTIEADGVNCARYVEKAFSDAKFVVSCGKTRLFYYSFGEAEDLVKDDRKTATTYIDYDDAGNVLGYAQETTTDAGGYTYLFYDGKKEQKPYSFTDTSSSDLKSGWSIRDESGNELVTATMEYKSSYSEYTITMNCMDEGSVDLYDKMLIVTRLLSKMQSSGLYNTD